MKMFYIELLFAPSLLAKCSRKSHLDDLALLDEKLYQGLIFLQDYEINVEDLCFLFSVTTRPFGESKKVDLIPNGQFIPVTQENRMRYNFLVSNNKLNVQIAKPFQYFFRRLIDLIDAAWLKIISEVT